MPIKLAKKFTNKTNLTSPAKVYKGLKTTNWGKREWMRLAVFLVVSGALGYITFNTFAATLDNTAHPDGSLVTFAGGHVYLIEGGLRRPVTSEDALYTNGYAFNFVVPATTADQALQPGPPLGLRAGQLITTSGAGVWVVVDSGNGNYTKWGVASQAAFTALGYTYAQVKSVPAAELPPDSPNYITGTNHAGGQFIQGTDGITYMIGNGVKYRVADQSVLATYPFPVYGATAGDMAVPTAGFLPYHEGSLVSSPSSGKIYSMGCADTSGAQGFCNMQKHWFTDPNTFTSLGYAFNEVNGGVDGNLDAIPTGARVSITTATPVCLPSTNPPCNPASPVVAPDAPTAPGTPPAPPTSAAGTNPSGAITSLATSSPYTTLTSTSVVGGWAADNETVIKNVQIYIDGNLKGSVSAIRQPTTGICSATDSRPGCPNVGWQWQLGGTSLAVGTHTIHFVAIDNDLPNSHTWQSPDLYFNFGNISTNNPPSPTTPSPGSVLNNPPPPSTTLCLPNNPECTPGNPVPIPKPNPTPPTPPVSTGPTCTDPNATNYHGSSPCQYAPSAFIESPSDGVTVKDTISITGWAADLTKPQHKILSVKASVNGADVGYATTGQVNDQDDIDICAKYGNPPGCPNIGWQYYLNTTQYAAGTLLHVKFTVTDADSPASVTTIGVTYISVNTKKPTTCPPGQTGTPPKCVVQSTPPGTGATANFKVIYAYPSDVTPNSTVLAGIPVSIYDIQNWLKNNTSGKNALPYMPNGMAINVSNSIIQVKLPQTTAQYSSGAGMSPNHDVNIKDALTDEVISDLSASYPASATQHYLVFVDGAFQDTACGDQGGGYATIWVNASQFNNPAPCQDPAAGKFLGGPLADSFFQDMAPLHEMLHTLGLVNPCAPDYDKRPGIPPSHLNIDSDIMYYALGNSATLDAGHTNYYVGSAANKPLPPTCLGLTDPSAIIFFNKL